MQKNKKKQKNNKNVSSRLKIKEITFGQRRRTKTARDEVVGKVGSSWEPKVAERI
ncbi:hypothetical protein MA16_Dca027879 [Dendrobium catenatum]|uniref:Uncharacterized protein n=1 Tax=Dendrobium catenatum TaxID=906689 RepID=A0A2I0VCE0_9ASPA|nr:hypothetical protein MA16_Dca027879 [Dendrobium catenatum]